MINDLGLGSMNGHQFENTAESTKQENGFMIELDPHAGSNAMLHRNACVRAIFQIVLEFFSNLEIRPSSSDRKHFKSIENNGSLFMTYDIVSK